MSLNLQIEVEKLRAWLATNRWVDQYDAWWSAGGVVSALQQFLADVQPADWSEDDVTDLLYILEQSSTDYIAELVTQSESMTLEVANHSLKRGGVAGDDIAERLGHCMERRDEAEALLLRYSQSAHERTRRMALLSLAALESAAVPALAIAAWKTGDEYQRMGALSALKTIGSELFPTYFALAEQDGRKHLVSLVRKYNDELTHELGQQSDRLSDSRNE